MSQPHSPAEPPGEFDLIARFRALARAGGPVRLGIGDDCAALGFTPGRQVLVTTDMLLDGRHFLTSQHTPEEIGRKAMGVNLSDIAAMAGRPVAAVVSVALPLPLPLPQNPSDRAVGSFAQRLFQGLHEMASRFGVALVGGDTNAWAGPLVVNVALLGEAGEVEPVRRSGARAGDVVFVTGPLGGSLESGRHMRPQPRIEEALALSRLVPLHALIDISDGLASDLGHILEESGNLGARLVADAIPIHADAGAASARDGRTPLDHALNDGEDFELCVVVPPDAAARLAASPPVGVALHRIGVIVAEPGLWIVEPDGSIRPIQARGFDHLRTARGADTR